MPVIASPFDLNKQHDDDAGFDLRIPHDVTLYAGEPVIIDLPVKVAIPSNCVGMLVVRSSIGAKGITFGSGAGIIDAGYRGNIKLNLVSYKNNQTLFGGDRVAQLLVLPLQPVAVSFVNELDDTRRGENGFGSTGTV